MSEPSKLRFIGAEPRLPISFSTTAPKHFPGLMTGKWDLPNDQSYLGSTKTEEMLAVQFNNALVAHQ